MNIILFSNRLRLMYRRLWKLTAKFRSGSLMHVLQFTSFGEVLSRGELFLSNPRATSPGRTKHKQIAAKCTLRRAPDVRQQGSETDEPTLRCRDDSFHRSSEDWGTCYPRRGFNRRLIDDCFKDSSSKWFGKRRQVRGEEWKEQRTVNSPDHRLSVFSFFFSGFNLYWWKGIHFS